MTTFPLPTFAMIPDMVQAIHMLDRTGLQQSTVDVLTTYTPSPVALCAQGCEALYADACYSESTCSDAAKVLLYGLAQMCVDNAWWDIGSTTRGPGMCLEMRRQLGDPSVTVTEAERPDVASSYTLEKPVIPSPMANAAS